MRAQVFSHLSGAGRMRAAGLALGLAALFCVAGKAHGQEAEPGPEDKPRLACLVKGAEALAYPEKDRDLALEGLIRVKMRFTAPDKAPEVEFLFRTGSEAMADSVQSHLASYRLPCLPKGDTTEAVQEFSFVPRGGEPVHWSTVRAVAGNRSASLLSCMRTPSQAFSYEPPRSSDTRLPEPATSNLIVTMRFEKADAPPVLKIIYDKASAGFRAEVLAHLSEYRLPCLPADARPFLTQQQFRYEASSVPQLRFKDSSLNVLLRMMKDAESKPVRFDFNTMGCPFRVVWQLGLPALPNQVAEVGARNLNRTEFLAWLAGLTMTLSREQFELLLGKSMLVTVPCATLSLG